MDKKMLIRLGSLAVLLYFGKRLEEHAQHKQMMQDLRDQLDFNRRYRMPYAESP